MLIFSRIKEEVGKAVLAAAGNSILVYRAFTTILDDHHYDIAWLLFFCLQMGTGRFERFRG